jgi:hypothetical protein
MDGSMPFCWREGSSLQFGSSSIPTFSKSCFRLAHGLCQHIDGLLMKFWWGCMDGKQKTCWVVWDEMTQPKCHGGLGFWDMELFNLALLAKQAWRILQDGSLLSARVLKSVYFLIGISLQPRLDHIPPAFGVLFLMVERCWRRVWFRGLG